MRAKFPDMPDEARAALRQTSLRTRNTTYGEVVPQSIWKHVIASMNLTESDVFYDIGSGTGKIPLQVALQSKCRLSKGVEFVQARHDIGIAVLERLKGLAAAHAREVGDAATCDAVSEALPRVQLIQGDACSDLTPLEDATAIFINNTVFQPDLMSRITERLATLPNLRIVSFRWFRGQHEIERLCLLRALVVPLFISGNSDKNPVGVHCALQLVTLRRICARHRDSTCGRKHSACCAFQHPAEPSGIVWPTWDNETTMFVYRREARITDFFRAGKAGTAAAAAGKPKAVPRAVTAELEEKKGEDEDVKHDAAPKAGKVVSRKTKGRGGAAAAARKGTRPAGAKRTAVK